jgi:hypothetical protein
MKKFCLFLALIVGLFNGFSQTPITLTFQAKDSLTQNALALDSVNVKNLAENCDTTLYEAVSVLDIVALWPVGIDEPTSRGSESFAVMQNTPNPFQGSTLVRVYLRNAGELNLAVYDNQGKKLSQYHDGFEKGWHLFGISTNRNSLLLLKVTDNAITKTIKILSAGAGHGGERISCMGQPGQGSTLKSVADAAGFIYYLGNQLQYTAYADGYHEATLVDSPSSGKTYTFAMLPLALPTVTTVPVYDISTTTATCGGNVTSDGGAFVTVRGVCWSMSPNPTTAGSYTADGAGIGSFISYLSSLIPGAPYYIRAYATNSVGTAYGEELTFTTLNITIPTVTTAPVYNITQTTATSGGNVTSDGGATVTVRGICWATTPNPTTADSHTADGGGTGSFMSSLTGLTPNTPYYVKAYAINSIGTAYGSELTFITMSLAMPTVTTTPASDITQTTATSGGNVTSDGGATVTVRGVCWSTSSNPTTSGSHSTDGGGTGSFTSYLTGLTANTPYYIRAYATNSIGTAYGNELTFTTQGAGFTCGTSMTINHITGTVAPVDKTVTYGTVANIPGETSKCWITSNLGSDHQATAVDDATEASAGLYWQFNRKQGYKHDGTTRTPNTAWISSISENSDWIPANDPCTLELGSGWRIPTNGEWTNVKAGGNWTNWNGPWNSALKMHAAGYLIYGGGSLFERGSGGTYWNSAQDGAGYGWLIYFDNGHNLIFSDYKTWGFSIRCIKE